mgnify:CR=1 FL=1
MKSKILFAVIGALAGALTTLMVQVQQPPEINYAAIQQAMTEAATKIEVAPAAVNMEVQKLDWGEIEKLKIRGDFIWSPKFNADNLILRGHEGIPYDSNQVRTRSIPTDTPNAVHIIPTR